MTVASKPRTTPVAAPPGYWQRETSHCPQPLSPMAGSTILPRVNAGLRTLFEQMGILVETLEYREIGGWAYVRLAPLGGKDRKAPPPPLFKLLTRLVPDLRRRV